MRLFVPARAAVHIAALLILAGCTTTAARTRLGELARSHELLQVLAEYNGNVKAPAWAAAVVKDGKVVAIAGIGVRDVQAGTPLDVDSDLFHWGSVTKSVTATMISGLVQEGTLSWRATLSELLPDVPMREEYRRVTLVSLLDHRADLPPYTRLGPDEARRFSRYTGTIFEKRDTFMREVLQEAPPERGDTGLVYSNAGPAIAAHVAEVVTGQSWEELVKKHVFEPIRMNSAGFGLPASAGPEQTRGHGGGDADSLTVMGEGPMPASPMMDPAGNIRSTVHDMALYARAHLLGLRGRQGPLDSLAVQDLHTEAEDGRTMGRDAEGYAMGWGLRREGDQVVHWHNGGAGQFFAEVDIYPDDDLAIVITTNAGFPGRGAVDLVRRIRTLYVGD
jgi:CubicO group peptidase (beta-lactamase class C family)